MRSSAAPVLEQASRPSSADAASGLVMKSNAPFWRARIVRSPPSRESALTTITCTSGLPSRVRASRTASPFISGISMSRVSKSGFNSRTFCIAIRPLVAVPTTSTPGIEDNTSVSGPPGRGPHRRQLIPSRQFLFSLFIGSSLPSTTARSSSAQDGCRSGTPRVASAFVFYADSRGAGSRSPAAIVMASATLSTSRPIDSLFQSAIRIRLSGPFPTDPRPRRAHKSITVMMRPAACECRPRNPMRGEPA